MELGWFGFSNVFNPKYMYHCLNVVVLNVYLFIGNREPTKACKEGGDVLAKKTN